MYGREKNFTTRTVICLCRLYKRMNKTVIEGTQIKYLLGESIKVLRIL